MYAKPGGLGESITTREADADQPPKRRGEEKAPRVGVGDSVAPRRGTAEIARAYLEYLYSPEGQRLAAKHYYRPVHPQYAAPADLARFPKLELLTIEDFGGWQKVQQEHFADGGVFDRIVAK